MIHYTIQPKRPEAHLFEVTMTILNPHPEGEVLSLPAWIPGSYMIRDFAKNIVRIKAERVVPAKGGTTRGMLLELTQLDKHTWQTEPLPVGPTKITVVLRITYEVYAWDLSVRSAHLDTTHGFFNPASVLLKAQGYEDEACQVEIQPPEGDAYKNWRVATAMRESRVKNKVTPRYGFGMYEAANYDELIDHPVEMGTFQLATFEAYGIEHDVVITGHVPQLAMKRLCADLKVICEAQLALFEPDIAKPYARAAKFAPFDRYVFLIMAVGDGYGGLEHRASTALLCSRHDLPKRHDSASPQLREAYQSFLGLASHEYFHAWNVKRIKPQVFADYDLTAENYTSLLWFFEGLTSYYDDLMLFRTGLITYEAYLKVLEKTINQVQRGSGRLKQSLSQSSFEAWTKYYRQDENAPNAIVSYYTKGALLGLALDLLIQQHTQHQFSLDDVMRTLWQQYGKDFYHGKPVGVSEQVILETVQQIAGNHVATQLHQWVQGTEDLPLANLLQIAGVQYDNQPAKDDAAGRLGVRLRQENGLSQLVQVLDDGAAQAAGLAAGDVLVAIDNLRANSHNLEALLASYPNGTWIEVTAFRRDELMRFPVKLKPAPWSLVVLSKAGAD